MQGRRMERQEMRSLLRPSLPRLWWWECCLQDKEQRASNPNLSQCVACNFVVADAPTHTAASVHATSDQPTAFFGGEPIATSIASSQPNDSDNWGEPIFTTNDNDNDTGPKRPSPGSRSSGTVSIAQKRCLWLCAEACSRRDERMLCAYLHSFRPLV